MIKTVYRDKKDEISVLKYSPNGKFLAVGTHEKVIDFYRVPDYKRKHKLKDHFHSHPVTAFDYSENSDFVQSTCEGQELLYCHPERQE